MTNVKITVPNWVQLSGLEKEDMTAKRMNFIFELVQFIESNNIDVCKLYRGVKRIFFDKKGAYLYQYNKDNPWRYNERGMAQAKLELLRLKGKAMKKKECLPADAQEVQEAIEAYTALGWGHGCSHGERELTVSGDIFRFFRRGRWYSLEVESIRDMLKRAKKAQIIMKHFRSVYSLDSIPKPMRGFCLNVLRHVQVLEETGGILVEIRAVDRNSRDLQDTLKEKSEIFPATPRGIYSAHIHLQGAARNWLQAAK